jgi:hypothetical protein
MILMEKAVMKTTEFFDQDFAGFVLNVGVTHSPVQSVCSDTASD